MVEYSTREANVWEEIETIILKDFMSQVPVGVLASCILLLG